MAWRLVRCFAQRLGVPAFLDCVRNIPAQRWLARGAVSRAAGERIDINNANVRNAETMEDRGDIVGIVLPASSASGKIILGDSSRGPRLGGRIRPAHW
jgi:hypothetical protein